MAVFFCNVEGSETRYAIEMGCREIFLESLRRAIFQKSAFKVTNKGKLPWMFSLVCNLLKNERPSINFQEVFQDKNSCDCNKIRSSQIVGSVDALKNFHFNNLKNYQNDNIKTTRYQRRRTKMSVSTSLWCLKDVIFI